MSRKFKSSGNNNINISGGNVSINGGVNLGDHHNSPRYDEFGRLLVDARRTQIRRIPAKLNHVVFTSVSVFIFGALANFASIASVFSDAIPAWFISYANMLSAPMILVGGFCGIIGLVLKFSAASMGVPVFGTLETGSDGFVYLTRVRAKCPMCGGAMRMLSHSKSNADHTLVCSRNPNHRDVFDMTTLPDVAGEYADRGVGQ